MEMELGNLEVLFLVEVFRVEIVGFPRRYSGWSDWLVKIKLCSVRVSNPFILKSVDRVRLKIFIMLEKLLIFLFNSLEIRLQVNWTLVITIALVVLNP